MEFLIFVEYYLFFNYPTKIKISSIFLQDSLPIFSEHYSCDRQKFPHSLPKNILWSFLFLLNTTSSTFPESKLKFLKLCRKRAMTIFMFPSHYSCDRQKFPLSLPKNILWSFFFFLNTTSSTFPESKLQFRKLCMKRAMRIFMFSFLFSCEPPKFPLFLPKNIFWSFLFLLNTTSSTFPESKLKFRKLCRKRAITIFQSITAATGKNSLTPSLKTYYGVSYFC